MDYSAFHWAEKARKYAETIGTIFNVKGRVNTVQDLPGSGNKVGDLWLVGLATDTDLTEYAWLSFDNVTRWEKIGSTAATLSFSALTGSPYDNTNLASALNGKQDELTAGTGISITNNVISNTGLILATYDSVNERITFV